MATLCTDIFCDPICDFCKHYEFNADANGDYAGNGWCRLHKRLSDPADGCDDFYCFRIQAIAVPT